MMFLSSTAVSVYCNVHGLVDLIILFHGTSCSNYFHLTWPVFLLWQCAAEVLENYVTAAGDCLSLIPSFSVDSSEMCYTKSTPKLRIRDFFQFARIRHWWTAPFTLYLDYCSTPGSHTLLASSRGRCDLNHRSTLYMVFPYFHYRLKLG